MKKRKLCFFSGICQVPSQNCAVKRGRLGVQYAILGHYPLVWQLMTGKGSTYADKAMIFAEKNFPGILRYYGISEIENFSIPDQFTITAGETDVMLL